MKRLILILIISLVLSQTNYETQKKEVKKTSKSGRMPGGCVKPPRPRPKRCGPEEKLIDGKCYIPKPTCKPGEVYNDGKCEIKKPEDKPFTRRCGGRPCYIPHVRPPIRCGPGEIRIGGKCQKKTDDVPKEE